MSWVKIDDDYALHPKMLMAGLDGRGLDIAAICWSAKFETDGFIPDAAVSALAHDARNPRKVAEKLVEAGRWHRDEERKGYEIHDFLEYNFSRAQAEKHREDRSRAGAKGGSNSASSRQAKAEAKRKQELEQNGSTNEATPLAKSNPDPNTREIYKSSSSSELTLPARGSDDDENDDHPVESPGEDAGRADRARRSTLVTNAIDLVVDRKFNEQIAAQKPIGNEAAWRKAVRRDVVDKHFGRASQLVADIPSVTVSQLADRLEPGLAENPESVVVAPRKVEPDWSDPKWDELRDWIPTSKLLELRAQTGDDVDRIVELAKEAGFDVPVEVS